MNSKLRRRIKNPQTRALVDVALDAGWTVELAKAGHLKLRNPKNGDLVVMPATGSDHRGPANARSTLRQKGLAV